LHNGETGLDSFKEPAAGDFLVDLFSGAHKDRKDKLKEKDAGLWRNDHLYLQYGSSGVAALTATLPPLEDKGGELELIETLLEEPMEDKLKKFIESLKEKNPRSPGQKHVTAVNKGRAGGKAWAKKAAQPGTSKYGGTSALLERAETMRRRCFEIYGGYFHLKVNRNPEARREARRAGGRTRQAQIRVQREQAANGAQSELAAKAAELELEQREQSSRAREESVAQQPTVYRPY
jgi:hypothetical protein